MAKLSGKKEASVSGVNLTLLRALLILALGMWIYSPAFHGGWLGDDNLLVAANRVVRDPAGWWKIWFEPTTSMVDYQPIKFSVVWLQWHLWGDHTLGYHLTNVVLHFISCLLIWRLLSKFGLRWAWLGGLIFAVHPVTVESVAWISELKNTLSLPPLLFAMIFWIDFEDHRRPRDYFLALALFIVAMLCKGTAVMFPVVILLYAWWKRRKIRWNDLGHSIPFFVVSLILGSVTIWFLQQNSIGNHGAEIGGPFSRLALVGLTTSFYFSKCFFPIDLMPIYPHWTIDPSSLRLFLSWPVLIGPIYWFWTKRRGWGRHALLGVGFFLINLAPFVGFTAASYMIFSWVAEHTLYLPIIGLIGITVAGLEHLSEILPRPARYGEIGIVALAMTVLAVESHAYAHIYRSKEILCKFALKQNPEAAPAHLALALAYLNQGRLSEAMDHAEAVVKLNPDLEQGRLALGLVFFKKGRMAEAAQQFGIAIQLEPENADAHNNFAGTFAQSGRYPEAMDQFNLALKYRPDDAEALTGRGELKRCMGDWSGAIADLDHALSFDPDSSQARLSRGVLRQAKGDATGALSDLRRYRELTPKEPNVDYAVLWIWIIRSEQGQKASADQDLSAALNSNWDAHPGDLVSQDARFLLGQITEPAYLDSAASTDKTKAQSQLCEQWYYSGINRLLAGNRTAAATAFRACIATGKADFFEYTLAQGELNALESP